MTTTFKKIPTEELSKLSPEALKAYIAAMQAECDRIEDETTALRLQAKMDRDRTLEIKDEIKAWKEINEDIKKKKGMTEITDEEMEWLMDGNYEKYWGPGKCYFKPDQWEMKKKYAEVMGSKMDDSRFAGSMEMKSPNAWIDRKGVYHPVGEARHDEWAWTHILERYGKVEGGKRIASMPGGSAGEYLEKGGWVRLQSWKDEASQFFLPEKLTQAQKQTIDKYCKLYRRPLPFEDPLF